jgi:bifunctional non-homologous end joining protein LigD
MLNNSEIYTLKISKAEREGKIFLDYLRNQKGATAIAPYSTRARIHAPIATPLAFDELTNDIRDTLFTLKTMAERLRNLKSDPWEDFYNVKQSIQPDLFK